MVRERSQKQGRGQKLAKIVRLLSHHSLANCSLFLEELNGESSLVTEDSYSVNASKLLQNIPLGVSGLLKGYLIQCLSYNDVYSHPLWPAGKRSKLSTPKISLLEACHAILADVEEEYTLPRLHGNFAKNK